MGAERANGAEKPSSSAPAPKKPGVNPRGAETVDAILKAALHVLVEEGSSAFTLRRIAEQCGMNAGNVSRHFPRKEMLVQVLLEELLSPTEGLIERNIRSAGMSAEEALATMIGGSIDQINLKTITNLFLELWAMASHNDFVADRVQAFYKRMQTIMSTFVAELNPSLTPAEVEAVTLFINVSIEGTTSLTGYGRPWSAMMPQMQTLAVRSLVHLAKTVTSEDIATLPAICRLSPRPWSEVYE